MVQQYHLQLPAFSRGFHIITDHILNALESLPDKGLVNVFIQHTSAALSINENADPTVLMDFETVFDKLVPENAYYYRHTIEGSDDMPAHIKAAMLGTSLTIPVNNGCLQLGTWQGIYLCEFRNRGGRRKLLITVMG
ncbi:MAG TPA: YjbQ family protein [Bacteroidales bacterium]|nr:YjbQ family protein [Bacteroidales bacterium]